MASESNKVKVRAKDKFGRPLVVDFDQHEPDDAVDQARKEHLKYFNALASMSKEEISANLAKSQHIPTLVLSANMFTFGFICQYSKKQTVWKKTDDKNLQFENDEHRQAHERYMEQYTGAKIEDSPVFKQAENVVSEKEIIFAPLFKEGPRPAAAKRYINVIIEKLQTGDSAQNKDLIDELKKAPNLNLKKIIWKELEKRGFDEIKNDETLRNEICKNTLLHGSTESIDKLRQEFFDKAFDSPYFYMVKEKIIFRVPGITTKFKRGNVEFEPAQSGQTKITCVKSPNFDLDSNPFTRSLKKRMEKENYLAEAKAELSAPNKSDEDAIKAFDVSLDSNNDINNQGINYIGKEGREIKTRKAVLMEHRSSSALMVLLRKIVESVFGKKQENTVSNPSATQNARLGTNANTLFHTRAATQTRAEKNVLKPLQKFHSPSPKGKM